MQLRVSYSEMQTLIHDRTGKSISFAFNSHHSLHVGYDVTFLMKSSVVGLDLTIDRIEGTDLYLSYRGGPAIEFMVRNALSQVQNMPGAEAIEPLPDNAILIHLDRHPQLSQIVQNITINDIFFDEHFVTIDFTPKQTITQV